ncbi:SusC/RagA family TonB-linked outer membrane protein [Abyssalbus ytuae]|uniref:TonB-dependent receptor n=1 Tax=Abyssalbus ytuae TaxID=2926907 RepID=A0A9E6ZLB4_9FLAO|nr:TonB-dependent receptor [Abyssalbus ytuae]UOB16714.1 TonB-dependent receptor [Abyssalbus ytuae]
MKKYYLLLLMCTGVFSVSMAQTILKGTVVSKTDGMPIAGASIIPNNETHNGVATDFDGNFSLILNQSEGSIIISSIGFAPVELPYSGNQTFNVSLDDQISSLEEVVLIGYGSSKKGNITTSISTVDNIESISSRPVATLNDFLQGSVPGVTILQQGGDPTETANIVIRGYGSISSERPLIVVDGAPYYGPSINPVDIESVSVLKDAAAASIYGAQAASGVIVIQTKKGKSGKPKIDINYYAGIQNATNLPTALNAKQQADVYNLAADNAGSSRQSAHDAEQNPWGQVTRTNWIDEIFRSAEMHNANLNISGGADNYNYMTSFGYNKKEGVTLGTSSERYSFRLKSEADFSDKLSVGENIYYSRSEAIGTNTSSGYSGTIINAIYMPSAAPVYDSEGNFHGVAPDSQFAGAYGDVYNPVALLLRPTISNPVNYFNGNVYLNYEILEGLTFKTSYTYSHTNTKYKKFQPRIPELGRTNLNNYLYQSYSDTDLWIWDNQLTYNKSFGLHNLDLTAAYSAQHTDYEYYYQEGQGFSNEESYNHYMSNASSVQTPYTSVYEDALTSAIGRVMYNYNNRYFVSGSIRRDESSRLATKNQVDYFPSASLGWRISEENFFNTNFIDDLKFRASWGQIGNINSVGYYSFDVPLNTTTVLIGEDGSYDDNGTYVGQQSNPDLTWEISESIDFGLDATLFASQLSLTFDYFEKTTKDMIIPGLEDQHQGTSAADVNGGEVKNTGFEIGVNYKNKINSLNYSLNANISSIKNELINLDGYSKSGIDYVPHGDGVRGTLFPFRSGVGEEIYSYYLVPYQGIFQSQGEIDSYTKNGELIQPDAVPGDFKFQDTNDDGRIDSNDKVFMGSYLPDFTYNFGLQIDYKGLDFSMIFQGVSGSKAFNAYKYSTYNASLQGYNLDNRVLNAWTENNRNTDIPRLSTSDNNQNFGTASSWYLEDASYLRCKNVTLGYTFSDEINNLISNSTLRIYVSAENLFTITDYSGMDPEVGGKGLDVGKYPLSRTLTAGLSFSF